jgi:hypothetical protein
MNGPDKLDCYAALGCGGLQGTNTLAYWAHLSKLSFSSKMMEGLN